MEIVQSEEYLNAIDKEIIPFHRQHRDKRRTSKAATITTISVTEFCASATPSTEQVVGNKHYVACRVFLNKCAARDSTKLRILQKKRVYYSKAASINHVDRFSTKFIAKFFQGGLGPK